MTSYAKIKKGKKETGELSTERAKLRKTHLILLLHLFTPFLRSLSFLPQDLLLRGGLFLPWTPFAETARWLRKLAEVEPLRSAVKKLRTAFGAVRSATAADGGGGGSTTSSTSTSSTSTSSSADGAEEAAVEQEIRSMCMWYSEVNDLLAGVSGVSMDTAESFGATTARINIHGCETSSEGAAADVKALVVHFEPDSTRVTAAEVRSSVFLAVSRCFSLFLEFVMLTTTVVYGAPSSHSYTPTNL